MLHLDCI